jgi:hypothetical protein
LFVYPLARLDILDAGDWQEDQRPGLGLEMSEQVEAAIHRAAQNPWRFAVVEGMTRRSLCRRFPYAVFFEVDEARLVVLTPPFGQLGSAPHRHHQLLRDSIPISAFADPS